MYHGRLLLQPLSGGEERRRMASKRQSTFSVSSQPLLCVIPASAEELKALATSKSFYPCFKQGESKGKYLQPAAQTLADGPSTWKTHVSLLSMDAASEALQKIQLWACLPSENILVLFEGDKQRTSWRSPPWVPAAAGCPEVPECC